MQGASGGQDPFGGDPFMWTPPAKATSGSTSTQTAQEQPPSGASVNADIFDLFGPSPGVPQQSQDGHLRNGNTDASLSMLDPFASALQYGQGKASHARDLLQMIKCQCILHDMTRGTKKIARPLVLTFAKLLL